MKFKEGKLYYIRFEDHAFGIKKVMMIEAVGWCIKESDTFAVFSPWVVDDLDKEVVDDNHEPFTVVKSCIKRKRLLRYGS